MLSDEEIKKHYDGMKAYFGDSLANFEHYPNIFKHQCIMYKYYLERKKNVSTGT